MKRTPIRAVKQTAMPKGVVPKCFTPPPAFDPYR